MSHFNQGDTSHNSFQNISFFNSGSKTP